jgi:hypothetical protein
MKWYLFVIFIVLVLGISLSLIFFAEEIFSKDDKEVSSSSVKQNPLNNTVTNSESKIKTIPLTDLERQKVEEALLSSEFIQDVPKKNPISIKFYYFENSSRVWQDKFYMSDGEFVSARETGMGIIIHSKYIEDLGEKELCSVVQDAKSKGDLGIRTDYSETQLMWKYKSMLGHKDCFGI